MTFLAPLALTLFAPWSALAWWLLTRRHDSTKVPFVELWKTEVSPAARPRRTIRRPPMEVVMLIVATALAILGGARPAIRDASQSIAQPANAQHADLRIVDLAARVTPKPAMMVRVRNDSAATTTRLLVNQDGKRHEEVLDALPSHSEREYFFDLPVDTKTLTLSVREDPRIEWKAVRRDAARIQPVGAISPELLRMIDVYAKSRPAPVEAPAIVVTDSLMQLADRRGVAVVQAGETLTASASPRIVSHAITKNLADLRSIARDASIATDGPRDWTPLATIDARVLLAIRETPARQVWIGFHSTSFARSPAFVVFWTDVFDWLGERSESGGTFAVEHVEPASEPAPPAAATAARSLAPYSIIASLMLFTGAMMIWPRVADRRC